MANQHTSNWTPERKAELAALYPSKTAKELALHFATTAYSIDKQTRNLGLRKAVLDFSPEEHALVAAHYPKGGSAAVQAHLPGRKLQAIRNHANRHGIRYTPLTDLEVVVLRSLCAQGLSYESIGRSLGKSKGAIQGLVRTLGITKVDAPKSGNPAARVSKPRAEKPPKPERVRYVPLHLRPEIQQPVAAYVKEGRSGAFIGKEMELGKSTVQRTLAALGLTTVQPKKLPLYRAGIRPPKPKPAPAPKPAPKPAMRVVRDEMPDVRFQPKPASGKKSPSKVVEGGEKTSDYLKSLPRLHPHQIAYERLTRPGQPRRDLRYKSQLLAALEETQPLQNAA